MFVALAFLLLQVPSVQFVDNPVAHADRPAVAVAVSTEAAEPTAPSLRPADLPLADLRTRTSLALMLSAPVPPSRPAVELPAHPTGAIVGTLNSAPPLISAVGPKQGSGAGLVSVVELQQEVRCRKRAWFALGAVEHGAAAFDAWSTRRAIANGGQELNPIMKPFANSGAIYVATQVAPFAFDFLGKHMMMSRSPLMRRLWWLPQTASTAASVFCGAHNLRVQ